MISRFFSAMFFIVLGAGQVSADVYQDCLRATDPKQQLRACDTVSGSEIYSREQRARALRVRGMFHAKAGAHERAIREFNAALKMVPNNTSALEKRALSHVALGAYGAATSDLTLLLKRKPKVAQYFVERGYVHMINGKLDAAISDFTSALVLKPRSAVALNNRGLALRKKGALKEAEADFTTAIMIAPTYALAFANRGYIFEAQGKKKKAISDLRRALIFDPKLAGVNGALARLGDKTAASDAKKKTEIGKEIAQKLCSRCHALDRKGASLHKSAPPFRDIVRRYPLIALRQPISRGIAAPHDDMPSFSLSEAEIDNLVAFVNSLN